MNPFDLPENKYGNVTCWNEKDGVIFPDGFTFTTLSTRQLKKLKIPTAKAIVGFDFVRIGGKNGRNRHLPKLINIIKIEDSPKATHYVRQLQMTQLYKLDNINELNWLFE